jgi:hypothetical protein
VTVTDAPQDTARTTANAPADADVAATAAWLESEFPGWSIEVDETSTWEGDLRPLWLARRDGHHPQGELTPAKLHTRLSEYHAREEQRHALAN